MPETRPNLLFACIENANRSQMADGDARPMLPAVHRLDWELNDPKHLDDAGFRAVRDKIETLVGDLIAEATRSASAQEQRHG